MVVPPIEVHQRIGRWSNSAALFAGACDLLSVLIIDYHNFIQMRPQYRGSIFAYYPEIVSQLFLLTPLIVVIVYRRVTPITFTYALMLSSILAGRIYYLARFFIEGALVPKMDLPGLSLIFLGVASLGPVSIGALLQFAAFLDIPVKRTDGLRHLK
jgi:hypothetical protein